MNECLGSFVEFIFSGYAITPFGGFCMGFIVSFGFFVAFDNRFKNKKGGN